MKRFLAVSVALALCGCGASPEAEDAEQAPEVLGAPDDGLVLEEDASGLRGTFAGADGRAQLVSAEVEPGVYRLEVRVNGVVLTGLLDPAMGASTLDGFAEANAQDTQLVDADRAALGALYAALNARLPAGDAASAPAMYLRRAVGLWAQQPGSVELQRTVLGEQGRGYTMLCSYARCSSGYTGSCSGGYNWYSYAKHDCQHGGFESTINQQIAQLGDHGSCSGDELYLSGGYWYCGEPDHWSRPKVKGICFGRCGGGCGGDTQYTRDATNHDGCVRNGHMLASAYCDDQFTSASDDELFAPNCY